MGFVVKVNDSVIVDGAEFVNFYDTNKPNFTSDKVGNLLNPRLVNRDYIEYSGYTLNVKSTIYRDAVSSEIIDGYQRITTHDTNSSIILSYLEVELVNYERLIKGHDSYFFPTHDLLKLFYWFSKAASIIKSEGKLKKIRDEILAKAEYLATFKLASESMKSYGDLLNSTCDFYSELMFASICYTHGMDVTLNGENDFVVNNEIAEVKSIHDDFGRAYFDRNDGLLTKSIPSSYTINDLNDEISGQLIRKKWIYHFRKAVSKQRGKIVFVNATQSPELSRLCIFIEENNLENDIKKLINNALEVIDKEDVIPAIVTMEAIYIRLVTSSFLFLIPIIRQNGRVEIDTKRCTKNYIKQNIFLS